MTTFGDQVYQHGGVPVGSAPLPLIMGNTYFVSSVSGSSGNDGTKERPYLTIQQAIINSTNNDCIICMPGHTETISSTVATNSSLTFHVDSSHVGLTIWGVGEYDYRPTFTIGAAAANIELMGANCRLHNLKFLAGTTATANCILVDAVGVKITNCLFEEVPASTYCFHDVITTASTDNAADGLHVEGCFFYQPMDDASGSIVFLGAHQDATILNNKFICGWTSGGTGHPAIYGADTASFAGLEIAYNKIVGALASGTVGIHLATEATLSYGWIHNNYIGVTTSGGVVGTEGVLVGTSCNIMCFENYYTCEPLEQGALRPVAYTT